MWRSSTAPCSSADTCRTRTSPLTRRLCAGRNGVGQKPPRPSGAGRKMSVMKTILLAACRSLLALLAVGCVTSSDVQRLQSQINELQEQVAQVKRSASSKEEVQTVNQ